MTVLITTRKNIVALRKAKGLSQEQLAEYSNISSPLLHHLETGCQNTTIDTLRRIAIARGVSPLALGILSLSDSEIRSVIQKPSYTPPEVRPFQIGENIALLRKAKGFSQRKLAELSHVSVARLRDIEHGCANVSLALLGRIAKGLEISLPALGSLGLSDEQVLSLVYQARAVLENGAAQTV